MELRNKKTGEIAKLDSEHTDSLADFGGKLLIEAGGKEFSYDTLAKLNEDWEDYKPTEPLIKDEKIRKAVRAWAEINDLYSVEYKEDSNGAGFDCIKSTDELVIISFASLILPLKKNRVYTITELCGEE